MTLWPLLLLVCLQVAPVAGDDAPAPRPVPARDQAPPARPLPPTRMGLELLSQDPVVAEVETVRVTSFGMGTAVVRMRVVSALHPAGLAPGTELVVFAYDGHFLERSRDLVYLLPFRRGGRWRVLQRLDGRDPAYRAKLQVTRAMVALLDERDPERQASRCFDLLVSTLASSDDWSRAYALAELRFMAARRPDLFTPSRRAALSAVAASSPYPEMGPSLEVVVSVVEAATRSVSSRVPPESSTP